MFSLLCYTLMTITTNLWIKFDNSCDLMIITSSLRWFILPQYYRLVVLIDWCSRSNLKAVVLTWVPRLSSAVRQQSNTILVTMQKIMQFRSREFNHFWCSSLIYCLRFIWHPVFKSQTFSVFRKIFILESRFICYQWLIRFIIYRIHAI